MIFRYISTIWRELLERKAAERKLRMLTEINLQWNGLHDADS